MIRPILIIFLLLNFFPSFAIAQALNLDSLTSVLPNTKGKQRIDLLNQLATDLRERDQAKTLTYSYEADSLSRKAGDIAGQSRALENIGWVYYRKGQWQKSFEYSARAYDLAMQIDNKLQAARLMNNTGALYFEQQNYQKAISEFKKGYLLATQVNDLATRIRSLNNVAYGFVNINEPDSALNYANLAIKLNENSGSSYLTSFAHRVIGDVLMKKGNYDSAKLVYRTSLKIARQQGVKSFEAGVLHRLGNAYLLSGELDRAEQVLLYSVKLCEENSFLDELSKSHRHLTELYEKKGDVERAYLHQSEYIELNDSLQSKSNKDRLALIQNMFQNNLKESEFELLKAQNENQTYRLATSRRYIIFFAITAALIAILGAWMFFLNRKNISINEDLLAQQGKIEEQNQVLEIQRQELQGMNETKSKLFSILGHDMRGPIAQVKTVVDMVLAGHFEKDEFIELLHVLNKDIDSVYFTLNNTLRWSMSQMKGFQVNLTVFKLTEVVENSLKLLEGSINDKNLTVFNQMGSNVQVYADQDLIEVVVRNIVNNAVKFSNPGDAITIFSETDDKWVMWCVLDQGIGMSEEQIQLVLSDSYALTRSTPGTNKEKGSGLGLQLAKEFIRTCGGEITIESHPGHGSKFWVRLPRPELIFNPKPLSRQEEFKS